MTDWKRCLGGAIWILATLSLCFGACAADQSFSVLFGELALPALVSLVVATFVPGAQEYLPWGRAWQRWQRRRVARGIEEMEEEVEQTDERVEVKGVPYRGGIAVRARPKKRRSDRRWAVALVVGGILTAVLTLAVRGFLFHRDLAMVTLASGLAATVVLALASTRDAGRAEAKAKLRVEEGVREMEAKQVRIEEQAVHMEAELQQAIRQEER